MSGMKNKPEQGKPRPVPWVNQQTAHTCRVIDSCMFEAGFVGRFGGGVEQDWTSPRGHLRQCRVLLVALKTAERDVSQSPPSAAHGDSVLFSLPRQSEAVGRTQCYCEH